MENQINSSNQEPVVEGASKYKLLFIGFGVIALVLFSFLGYFFFLKDSQIMQLKVTESKKVLPEEVIHSTSDSFTTLQEIEGVDQIQEQFKRGEFAVAEEALEKVLEDYNFTEKDILSETALLFKLAAQLGTDRDGGLKGYYDFYTNRGYSNVNRAYALLMAAQNVLANNDPQKLLVYLNEDEIKKLNNTKDPEEIFYQINKKIFMLYPFPIVSARMAVYELKGVTDKKTAEGIFKMYTFKLDENLAIMVKNKGYNHFAANSYGAVGLLYSRMEDFGLVKPASTTAMFETAYTYSKIYSVGSTPHFMLFYYIDYQAKKSDVNNVKKLLSTFVHKGNTNSNAEFLHSFVKTRFVDERTFQYYFPYLYKLYSNDESVKIIVDEIVR